MRNLGRASSVAAGILSSRILGFVRQALIGSFFGVGRHADVLAMAFRGPNLLQNLLGEQSLSASFIPIYTRMREEGREEEARRFAGGVFGLLLAVAGGIALFGILLAEPFVAVVAPGFLGDATQVAAGNQSVDRYRLAVRAVRFMFPMTAFLVLAAWTLGVLNSHRKFFLPYVSPVFWNASIITALVAFRPGSGGAVPGGAGDGLDRLLFAVCAGAVVGGSLQFLVQLPSAIRELGGLRPALSLNVPGVREALRAFGPLIAGRGVVQLSSYLDIVLASLLTAGAVSCLGYGQTLYVLPISLFAMSVAATTLPELSREGGSEDRTAFFRTVDQGLTQTLFLTVPTCIGYLLFGFLIVGLVFRRGRFDVEDQWLVYFVLAGYSIGMLATSASRVFNNMFFALGETRTPARIAVERVLLSGALGAALMLQLDKVPVGDLVTVPQGDVSDTALRLGAVGLSVAAGFAAWYEWVRLVGKARKAFPGYSPPSGYVIRIAAVALLASIPAAGVWFAMREWRLLWVAPLVIAVYAGGYLVATGLFGLSRLDAWLGRSRKSKRA